MANANKSKQARSVESYLAYQDPQFLESSDARTLRIMAEYLEPQVRLRRQGVQNTVVFFGSARILPREEATQRLRELERRAKNGRAASAQQLRAARMVVQMSRYYEDARELARLLTRWSLAFKNGPNYLMICSGGGPGIMEAANRGAKEAGGGSIGLNIKLPMEQKPNPYITPQLSFIFRYFFMRKLWFAQPAKAFIAFPGGYGTMDELWEFLTLEQTHKITHQATIMLYGTEFWKKAINFDCLLEAGTVTKEDLKLICFADDPQEAFEILKRNLGRELGARTHIRHPFF